MGFDPIKDTVATCLSCRRLMIVKDFAEPLNQYVYDLGYRRTGRYWHKACLYYERPEIFNAVD